MSKKFKPGESGNPAGRPKGAKGRNSSELQKALIKLLDENIDLLSDDIKKLPPDKRSNLLLQLARHVTPQALQPERLTEEQMQQVIDYIKQQ